MFRVYVSQYLKKLLFMLFIFLVKILASVYFDIKISLFKNLIYKDNMSMRSI